MPQLRRESYQFRLNPGRDADAGDLPVFGHISGSDSTEPPMYKALATRTCVRGHTKVRRPIRHELEVKLVSDDRWRLAPGRSHGGSRQSGGRSERTRQVRRSAVRRWRPADVRWNGSSHHWSHSSRHWSGSSRHLDRSSRHGRGSSHHLSRSSRHWSGSSHHLDRSSHHWRGSSRRWSRSSRQSEGSRERRNRAPAALRSWKPRFRSGGRGFSRWRRGLRHPRG